MNDEQLKLISKKGCLFLLNKIKSEDVLIAETAKLFERSIEGDEPSEEEWDKNIKDLDGARARAWTLDLDGALALALALARDRALAQARDRAVARALALVRARDLALVKYLLTELGDYVPIFEKLENRIVTDIKLNGFHLEMGSWHTCDTTHCMAGFAELYAGDNGKKLVKHFGHWLTGAMIFYKSTGEIPDFYASNEDAMKYLEERAV